MPQIHFTENHQKSFCRLSYDCNPLHLDPEYAKRTVYAQPVVHGVSSTLAMLGHWSKGRSFRLKTLDVFYRKPMYFGDIFDIETVDNECTVGLKLTRGGVTYSEAFFTWEPNNEKNDSKDTLNLSNFNFRTDANDISKEKLIEKLSSFNQTAFDFPYNLNFSALKELSQFHLSQNQIPLEQLQALLSSSYLIGMEIPGKQALFLSCNFIFEPPQEQRPFALNLLKLEYDERFGKISLSGRGTGISDLKLSALLRPKNEDYSIHEIQKTFRQNESLKGQTVFITGASRGFGSVVAQAFALYGAEVYLNYLSNHVDAKRIQNDIVKAGGKATLLPGDVSSPTDCEKIADSLKVSGRKINFFIHNAFPPILPKKFSEQTPEELALHAFKALKAFAQLTHTFLPIMENESCFTVISSVYVENPKENFTHYIAAKAAVEGLCRALAMEYKKVRFISFRAPRMRTDQTNVTFDLEPRVSCIDACKDLFKIIVPDPH